MCFLYSVKVVAPMQCKFPRAKAGFNILDASTEPSAAPAPTTVCNSSIKRIMRPSDFSTSESTAFKRSSNSPRNFAPATIAAISSSSNSLSKRFSGTSRATILRAKPSTIAVLPTPGSPIKTGLFFLLRDKIWMQRRISSSLPITGSNFSILAKRVKLRAYFSNA